MYIVNHIGITNALLKERKREQDIKERERAKAVGQQTKIMLMDYLMLILCMSKYYYFVACMPIWSHMRKTIVENHKRSSLNYSNEKIGTDCSPHVDSYSFRRGIHILCSFTMLCFASAVLHFLAKGAHVSAKYFTSSFQHQRRSSTSCSSKPLTEK